MEINRLYFLSLVFVLFGFIVYQASWFNLCQIQYIHIYMCVCVRARVCMRAYVCVRACVCMRVCECGVWQHCVIN